MWFGASETVPRRPLGVLRLPASDGATGLGPVEQLVLRGDGLTTTSLEILTGHEIYVEVRRHWQVRLPEQVETGVATFDDYAGFGAEAFNAYVTVGYQDLECAAGQDLLIRQVLLRGMDGVTYGTASLFAVIDRLPPDVAHQLATTGVPIGKLLVRAGKQVERELRSWGLFRAGDFAAHLGPGVEPESRVPARTYRMRSMTTGEPLTLITEWFAPRLFDLWVPADSPSIGRPPRHRWRSRSPARSF
jgi:chorismate-pyruvate lyase